LDLVTDLLKGVVGMTELAPPEADRPAGRGGDRGVCDHDSDALRRLLADWIRVLEAHAAVSMIPPAPSARGALGRARDRSDVGKHAAGVPGWKCPYERRRAVELDAALAGRLGPGELAGVPFDEGFGLRRDVEVLGAGVRLADLGVSELDEQ